MIVCVCGRYFHHGVCYNCGNTQEEKFIIVETPEIFSPREKKVIKASTSKNKREHIFDRDGRKCLKCGFCEGDSSKENRSNYLTIDHVIPLSKGGTNNINNLQTLCNRCNLRKGNLNCDDYRVKTPIK